MIRVRTTDDEKDEAAFSGFTLLEIMVVLMITAALAAVALPRMSTTVERMRASEGEQVLLTLLAAQKRYAVNRGGFSYATALTQLDVDLRPLKYFGMPRLYNDITKVADITRTDSYTLAISSTAVITCSGGVANLCSKIGY